MKRDLKYYQDWMSKCHKVKYLSQEIKKHIWLIEWRLLCKKWFDDKAEESTMFPKVLRYE